MNTTASPESAVQSPKSSQARAEVAEKPTKLWRLPVGARFYDFYGKQVFTKIGVCTAVKSRRTLHVLRCDQSPFTILPGPVCAAFFCAIGDVVFRGGSVLVFPIIEPAATGGAN